MDQDARRTPDYARAGRIVTRLASMGVGVAILYHEVYEVDQAEIAVIGLGLLFLGVPPALWLDTIARTTDAISSRDRRSTDEDQGA